MENPNQRRFSWMIGIGIVAVVFFSSGLNPLKQKDPSWQVIKESVAATVFCNDSERDYEGVNSIGYAPCVRLTNVTFDSDLSERYCYTVDVEVGGYKGQNYAWIDSWRNVGNEFYCVSWTPKYDDSDMNNPSDWRIYYGDNSPSDFVN